MNTLSNYPATAVCVACISSGRKLNQIDDQETKRIFSDLLDIFDISSYTLLLCYECVGRLKSLLCFRNQVRQAHRILTGCLQNNQTITMSRLDISKTEVYDWEPYQPIAKSQSQKIYNNEEQNTINNGYHTESDNDMSSAETDVDNFDATSDLSKSKQIPKTCKSRNHSNPTDTWEIKIEDVMQKNDNVDIYIKEEPIDAGYKETKVVEEMKSLTKYVFSDSDDEPLKAKKVKKKIKKEGKEQSRERPAGVVSGVWVKRKLQQLNVPAGQLEMVVLSWEEVEMERQKSLTNATYTRHEFRCTSCVVGFNHRFKLDSHLKKHLPDAGDLECSICKTRFKTQAALLCHRRRHRSRWRCTACLALFSRAAVAADHVARAHGAPPPTHACHVCGHKATSLGKLRVHLKSHAERQHCDQCGKTFRDKSSLRTHLYIHTNQMDFSCEVCDKKFRFKKALEIHSVTHQASELLYCADCDMNFKNRLSFYQHINYSMKHIHPDKVKYVCEYCPRRFSKPARLEEHRYSLHLKLAPHRCTVDGCTFASASRPALRTHTRMVHRNKRLERNHVCHTCGKAYTTKKILEGHIRSHTGERPFVCSRCPSTFSHDAALYNHNKLVHKTPFVRRRKANETAPIEPINWTIGVVNAGKVPSEAAPADP